MYLAIKTSSNKLKLEKAEKNDIKDFLYLILNISYKFESVNLC